MSHREGDRLEILRPVLPLLFCAIALYGLVDSAYAQTTAASVQNVLGKRIQPTAVTASQLQSYLMKRIPKLPSPSSPEQWRAKEQDIRKHVLEDVAFHGWPREWVDSAPKFEQVAVIETGHGYRLRKFRYDIVPGFQSTAILYEPENTRGKMPGILNVIGHEPAGNAVEYEQKRCINFAKRGIFALSLDWFGFGELAQPEDAHDFGPHLDLVGSNALGLFYLAMRRGLDYLATLPKVDTTRLGVTGLSGGGWQTTILAALDTRIAVSVEVAGFGALESNLIRPQDTDEIEENATDLIRHEDYPVFVAIRAPRPTLLIHNAEDDCCFRAALVKPYIYERVKSFFELFGKGDNLEWHENRDPSTHNYQVDNREHAYGFFDKHFGISAGSAEIPSDSEIRSADELAAGLPPQNLTILGLAMKLAAQITRPEIPNTERTAWIKSQREQLKSIVREAPVSVENAWRMSNTKRLGFESLSYRFDFSNALSATGVWLKAISAPSDAPAVIVLNDKGYKASAEMVSEHINRGRQVLAVDLLFTGTTLPEEPDSADWEMLVATTGGRPLGLETAQLTALAQWIRSQGGNHPVRIETQGFRSQVIALIAAALQPGMVDEIDNHGAIESLGYLLAKPVAYRSAPDLFCLDLYKYFDLDRLAAMAAPVEIKRAGNLTTPPLYTRTVPE